MATITKRGQRWSVQIRRKGHPAQSQTFATKSDAKAWAVMEEARIEGNEPATPRRQLECLTLSMLIDRYLDEVTPTKLSEATERQRLRKLQRDPIGNVSLAELSSAHIALYRDQRLRHVKAGTVRRELGLIQHALDVAQKEWGYRLASNPVKDVRQPRLNNARNRRLGPGEYGRLMKAVSECKNPQLPLIVQFAIETAMRRGEIINMRWENIDLTKRMIYLPHTKTGRPRTVPLSDGAISVLQVQIASAGPVFNITANALKLAWGRAVRRSGLSDLHFHDLRHEAVSRFFELGLSVPEVAIISGHRDPRMLFRYTHLRPDSLAQKLRGRTWTERSGEVMQTA
ncbi:tyrosine-type recombinase/integrase [Sphingomonas lacusdianchii]|uniref:tyrosine-type recombinase/integrase n=1 Tax=Sphingomonas lacusdianchii TaxID=2917992 RepID=UPI001F5658EA